jgi:hypothetical protein
MDPLAMKSFYRRLQMQGPLKPQYWKETRSGFKTPSNLLCKAPHNFLKGKMLMADSIQIKEIELEVQGMT